MHIIVKIELLLFIIILFILLLSRLSVGYTFGFWVADAVVVVTTAESTVAKLSEVSIQVIFICCSIQVLDLERVLNAINIFC